MAKYTIEQRDEQLLDTKAEIRYHLYFERAAQHLLRVVTEVGKISSATTELVMPSWMPGSYKIRDMVAPQGNVKITNPSGKELRWRWTEKNRIEVDTKGESGLVLEYLYYSNERSVRTNHISRWHASVFPVACLMYVEGRMDEIHHLYLHHDRQNWTQYSTSLSPVKKSFSANEPVILGALNYDILADSPIEIGNHKVREFEYLGAKHEVALVSQIDLDVDWLTEQTKKIVQVEADFWNGLPYYRYVFILHVVPGLYGGLEHARSNVSAVDPAAFSEKSKITQMLSLLVHEYFHTWNVKRIRPRELGPFDYTKENYTDMLWLAEGMTSYYDDLLTYRAGFYTRDEYLKALAKEHINRLLRVQGRNAMSVKDSGKLAWVKLYIPSGDSSNRWPSYYLKGGLVALMLDLHIISESKGKKSLDDGMMELWNIYKRRPELGVTEEEVVEAFEKATGVKLREKFLGWLEGREELPYEEMFRRVGIEAKLTAPKKTEDKFGENVVLPVSASNSFTGLGLKEDGRLTVTGVEDDSPAAKSGFAIDDEVLAVNGLRISSVKAFEDALARAGADKPVEVLAASDGRIYTAALSPAGKKEYELSIRPDATDEEKKLLEVWLKR